MATDFQLRVLRSLERDHGINPDVIARGLAGVIKGETVTENFDGSGNLTSRKVTTRPVDQAIGIAIFDRLSGGQLGIGKEIVGTGRTTRELYSEFMPIIGDDDESIIYEKPAITCETTCETEDNSVGEEG